LLLRIARTMCIFNGRENASTPHCIVLPANHPSSVFLPEIVSALFYFVFAEIKCFEVIKLKQL
jgi:hypothetical protein